MINCLTQAPFFYVLLAFVVCECDPQSGMRPVSAIMIITLQPHSGKCFGSPIYGALQVSAEIFVDWHPERNFLIWDELVIYLLS